MRKSLTGCLEITDKIRRYFTLLLVVGFVLAILPIAPIVTTSPSNDETGGIELQDVIYHLQNLTLRSNNQDSSDSMKALVLSMQIASGLVTPHFNVKNIPECKIIVCSKIPFLFTVNRVFTTAVLVPQIGPVSYFNHYESIVFPPPLPPPLERSYFS